MANANDHKKFTANGDIEAELLLKRVLSEMKEILSGTDLCVVLGGSYGRGNGGVRIDRANGILYNDLDFFVFSRKKSPEAAELLKKVAEKYEKELKVDVDFSRIMSIRDIKNNSDRLMMQELKRGYFLVCGEDLIAEYLAEIPSEQLPFAEACRLLLNRGMGLLLAGGRIAEKSSEIDFILRNINKAVLGACDAFLIAERKYKWTLAERLTEVNNSMLSDVCKKLYSNAVEFKKSPNREMAQNLNELYLAVLEMFKECMEIICGKNCDLIYLHCKKHGENSLKNYIKYCLKSRSFPLTNWKYYTMPAAALLLKDVFAALGKMPGRTDENGKLYQYWLIFN